MSKRRSELQTRYRVQVTEKDIANAHVNDSYKCVVAQAVARTIPDATRIEVDTQAIRLTRENGERWIYFTPYAVQGYVIAFDAGDPIEPFTFTLRDPKRIARHVKTKAGAAATNAARRVQRRAAAKRAGGTAVPPAQETRAAATAAYAEAAQAHGDTPRTLSDRGGPKAPPRVFKKKKRSYGHRLLRINQEAREA